MKLIKVGDIVQCWDESTNKCLGWGEIVKVIYQAKDITPDKIAEATPLIQLEKTGKIIWGDKCNWITEEAAVKAGINIVQGYQKCLIWVSKSWFMEVRSEGFICCLKMLYLWGRHCVSPATKEIRMELKSYYCPEINKFFNGCKNCGHFDDCNYFAKEEDKDEKTKEPTLNG